MSSKVFNNFNPKGVFPPELALDIDAVKLITSLGLKYLITAESSLPDHSIRSFGDKLFLVPRNRSFSNAISFKKYRSLEEYIDELKRIESDKYPVVLAMDIETFGEHHSEYWQFLFDFLNHEDVEPILGDQLVEFPTKELENFVSSSWSTEKLDIPFPLWKHPDNPIHELQHKNLEDIRERISNVDIWSLSDKDRNIIFPALHSCQFWWASGERRWSWDMVRKGLDAQMKARKILGLEFGDIIYTNIHKLMVS